MQFDDFDGGFRMMNTQTGNDTWFVLFAQMKKIKKDLKKKDKSDALGRLFGVLLFATEDDTFIWDNEVCTFYGNSIFVIKITNTVIAITTAINITTGNSPGMGREGVPHLVPRLQPGLEEGP